MCLLCWYLIIVLQKAHQFFRLFRFCLVRNNNHQLIPIALPFPLINPGKACSIDHRCTAVCLVVAPT